MKKKKQLTKREMHQKLCRCERKLKKIFPRSKAIGICVKSVLHSRGYTHKGFTCKGTRKKLKLTNKRKTMKKKKIE